MRSICEGRVVAPSGEKRSSPHATHLNKIPTPLVPVLFFCVLNSFMPDCHLFSEILQTLSTIRIPLSMSLTLRPFYLKHPPPSVIHWVNKSITEELKTPRSLERGWRRENIRFFIFSFFPRLFWNEDSLKWSGCTWKESYEGSYSTRNYWFVILLIGSSTIQVSEIPLAVILCLSL
jgi:hypothetical protein